MFALLAQVDDSIRFGNDIENFDGIQQLSLWDQLWIWLYSGPLSLLYAALTIWMIVYCIRNDPNRVFWMLVILLAQPFGVFIYFIARYLPSADFQSTGVVKRWKKHQAIPQLRMKANQIGNPYQFVLLGDAERDLRRFSDALGNYRKALSKEPGNLQALWGAGSCEFALRNFPQAKQDLKQVLDQEFSFRFGDVSLLYGKTLMELKEKTAAREHLENHIRRWRTPEAMYLLAKLQAEQGETEQARRSLNGLIADLQISPRAIARKSIFWKSRAQRMLRQLPK